MQQMIETKQVDDVGGDVLGLHHVSVIVRDTADALVFYQGILGLSLANRPQMSFLGAWLDLGAQQIHLLQMTNPDSVSGRPEHGGRDRHVALTVSRLSYFRERLQQAGVPYTLSASGRAALFCRDPDGNGVELIEIVA